MAVKLRLVRFGKKKKPIYRLAAANSSSPRDGKVLEFLGSYNPNNEPALFEIDNERVKYWLSNGAQPTETVHRLLTIEGILEKKERTSSNQGVSKKDREKSSEES